MKWFKFYGQDWLTDIKIAKLRIEDRLCFITLLCLASNDDNAGVVRGCDEEIIIKLTHLEYKSEGDCEYRRAKGVLDRLNDNGMITFDNGGDVIINNFLKRQGENLTGYERVKRYREKLKGVKKTISKVKKSVINDNVGDVINDNVRTDKIRIDKNRTDNTICERGSQDIQKVLDIFYEINPTLNFGNKTNRKSVEDLLAKFGLQNTIRMARAIVSVQGKKYAPTCTTPYQMKEKLSQFKIYFEKEKGEKMIEV